MQINCYLLSFVMEILSLNTYTQALLHCYIMHVFFIYFVLYIVIDPFITINMIISNSKVRQKYTIVAVTV